jgi:putative serine protease PepD
MIDAAAADTGASPTEGGGPTGDGLGPTAPDALLHPPVAAPLPGRPWTRGRLVGAAAMLVLVGALAGGVSGWLAATALVPAAPAVTLAPWDGPNIVGEAAARVTPSVYTVVPTDGTDNVPVGRSGTAVVWRADGLLVTNHHVAGSSGTVRLLGPDGRYVTAEVLGGDVRADVSVLRIPGPVTVPTWSDRVPPVGSLAVAIGAPFGFGGSVSAGIVSATHRSVGLVEGAALADVIQFDAAVNPGNSGGPLVNAGGEVFGLVTAIYSTSGVNDGVAFALPAELVSRVAHSIVEGGWEPGHLGVLAGDVAEDGGALVLDVLESTAADAAGLVGGDIIVAVDAGRVRNVTDLVAHISRAGHGATVTLTVERDGVTLPFPVVLGSAAQR